MEFFGTIYFTVFSFCVIWCLFYLIWRELGYLSIMLIIAGIVGGLMLAALIPWGIILIVYTIVYYISDPNALLNRKLIRRKR